jgi:hypothetical protein
VWKEGVSFLPIHSAVSGLAAAVGVPELGAHETPALNAAGAVACAAGTLVEAKPKGTPDQRHLDVGSWDGGHDPTICSLDNLNVHFRSVQSQQGPQFCSKEEHHS